MMAPDFREVAGSLRKIIRDFGEINMNPQARMAAHYATTTAEREACVQALELLYDHMTYYEQWREAAHLLAFAMPNSVAKEPRIHALVQDALKHAERVEDPEMERAHVRLRGFHDVGLEFLKTRESIAARGGYFGRMARIRGAETCLEYGCGSGSNVLHLAQLYPGWTRWDGVDHNAKQVELNNKRAAELGLNCKFYLPLQAPSGFYDAVAVLDTIEHTLHPDELLADAESFLKEDGIVVVSVPDGPWSLHTDNAQTNAVIGNHVAVDNPASLMERLGTRGEVLDVETIQGPNPAEGNATLCVTYQPRLK